MSTSSRRQQVRLAGALIATAGLAARTAQHAPEHQLQQKLHYKAQATSPLPSLRERPLRERLLLTEWLLSPEPTLIPVGPLCWKLCSRKHVCREGSCGVGIPVGPGNAGLGCTKPGCNTSATRPAAARPREDTAFRRKCSRISCCRVSSATLCRLKSVSPSPGTTALAAALAAIASW